uniref:Uncharacterized protein n=1 Tax=Rhizophora mucronata TaxID=61149 RepID=A0A2P2QBK8_RHIMU
MELLPRETFSGKQTEHKEYISRRYFDRSIQIPKQVKSPQVP